MSDERNIFEVQAEVPTSPAPADDDDNELAWRRERRKVRARLAELELVVSNRLKYLVPTSTSEPEEKHGLRCYITHPHVRVSMRTPRVECAVCGEKLDALDVLRQYAKAERNFAHTLEHLRKEKADLSKEVAELRRQRSSLRSTVKRRTTKEMP